jgi:alkyldihydroxyacetonephosphate synthase
MNLWTFEQEGTVPGEPAWRWLADWVAMPALLATPARPLAEMAEPASRLSEALRDKLIGLLGPRHVKQDLAERARHAGAGTADRLRLRSGDLSNLPDAVLYPRASDEVLGLLTLCAEAGVAVTPFGTGSGFKPLPQRGVHPALVSCDLSAMSHLVSVDTLSGLAWAEAGMTAEELTRQLAAQGASLKGTMEGSLGGHVARNPRPPWLNAARLATPQGMVTAGLSLASGSEGRFGIITSAGLQIGALPAKSEVRRYLFSDFAGGLTALREARRQGLIQTKACLRDAGETHFHQQIEETGRRRTVSERIGDVRRRLKQFDNQAAMLTIGFAGTEAEADGLRKRFDALAGRLGALPLGVSMPEEPDYRDLLMDRGLALDKIETTANWAKLPRIYAAMRASLDRAMRTSAPREGAHGLVLARVSDAGHESAKLRLTVIFPRALGNDVAQAQSVREAGLKALAELTGPDEPLEEKLRLGIKQMLDPKAILNPLQQLPGPNI